MEIIKLRSQLSIASERALVYREKAEDALARLQKSAAGHLERLLKYTDENLRKLRANSWDALLAANEIRGRWSAQVSVASKHVVVHVQKAQQIMNVLGKAGAVKLQDGVQKVRHESEIEWRKFGTRYRNAIDAADSQISHFGAGVATGSRRTVDKLQKTQSAVVAFGRTIVLQPRRMREARLAQENDLRNLLASAHEAIVVTDVDRRLVAANPKALELFGISEYNLRNFTIDAFLASVEPQDIGWNGSSLIHREDGLNRCKIRRLDGGLRVAACEYVADVLPHRQLYKFLNVAPYRITPPKFAKRNGHTSTVTVLENQTMAVAASENKPVKKIRRHGVRPVL